MKRFLKLTFFLFITTCSLKAQNDTLYFKHFNVDNGLSHHNVRSIIQDSLGFMWYGTEEGLSMFDGYKFLPFKHDPKDKNSLVSDDITCLAPEKKGLIWIGTKNKGLNLYNTYTGQYELFQHENKNPGSISNNNITSIFADTTHHLIWVGTENGLNAFDPKTRLFKTYKNIANNSNSISCDEISCIKSDKQGCLWIGTKHGGLNRLNLVDRTCVRFRHDDSKPNCISSDHVRDIFVDKQQNIWIATDNGLNKLDIVQNKFSVYKHDNQNQYSLSSNDLTSVYQDKYGKIWVGTANHGLCVYYPKTDKFIVYSYDKQITNSLSSNKINSISQGRSGMFWAATSNRGLNAFNPKTLKFNLISPFPKSETENIYDEINAILSFENNYLLIGTKNQGLYVYDFKNNTVTPIPDPIDPKNRNINCFYKDGETIWLGMKASLMQFDPIKNTLGQIDYGQKTVPDKSNLKADLSNLNSDHISCLYKDGAGLIWIGTIGNGVYVFNGNKNETKHFTSGDKGSIVNNSITSLTGDNHGNIWIGTCDGLSKYNSVNKHFKNYLKENTKNSISSNCINKIYKDSKGQIWITTKGGGLNKYLSRTDGFICYTSHDGLPGNSINGIMEDRNENFWIGSDYGICRLTFEKDKLIQCRIFDLVDGLPTTEFCEAKSSWGQNGRMIFSCNKGLITFNPDSLRNNPYKPPVVISDFHLFNRKIIPGDSTGILKASISVTKELLLNYDQNSFSFEYTAISFINSNKNKYAYKLEGFDKDWNYRNASNRSASYTNLDPGTYTFRVKASNNDGVWNDVGTSLIITIAAPFWKTWWFCTLLGLCILLIGYSIYYVRLRNIIKLQEVRNKISRDLHDQIGSTLSSISIYSEVAKQMISQKAPEAIPILDGLGESARSSIESMSDIVWAVNPANDKFYNIVERLRLIANQLLEAKHIELKFDVPESINELTLSMEQRKNLYLILKEAINNVAKYSDAAICTIKAERTDRKVNIRINDNGKGFESVEKSLGGNGLINMRQRAQELNGVLSVFSEKQKGTELTLEFQL